MATKPVAIRTDRAVAVLHERPDLADVLPVGSLLAEWAVMSA